MRVIALIFLALSFGAGLLYLHLAVYENPYLNLVGRYLLAIYGGFMGLKLFECVIERRGKQIDRNARGKNNNEL